VSSGNINLLLCHQF